MTATYAVMGGILKILNLSEISLLCLVTDCICQLRFPATNTAYLVGFRSQRILITTGGKFATVSRGIFQAGSRNLEKFAMENCGSDLCCEL